MGFFSQPQSGLGLNSSSTPAVACQGINNHAPRNSIVARVACLSDTVRSSRPRPFLWAQRSWVARTA
jgi:hypothetical protein